MWLDKICIHTQILIHIHQSTLMKSRDPWHFRSTLWYHLWHQWLKWKSLQKKSHPKMRTRQIIESMGFLVNCKTNIHLVFHQKYPLITLCEEVLIDTLVKYHEALRKFGIVGSENKKWPVRVHATVLTSLDYFCSLTCIQIPNSKSSIPQCNIVHKPFLIHWSAGHIYSDTKRLAFNWMAMPNK